MRIALASIDPFLGYSGGSNSGGNVTFIPQDHEWHPVDLSSIRKGVAPVVELFVRLLVTYIIYDHAAVSTSVKGSTQRLESFLPRGIPQLKHA